MLSKAHGCVAPKPSSGSDQGQHWSRGKCDKLQGQVHWTSPQRQLLWCPPDLTSAPRWAAQGCGVEPGCWARLVWGTDGPSSRLNAGRAFPDLGASHPAEARTQEGPSPSVWLRREHLGSRQGPCLSRAQQLSRSAHCAQDQASRESMLQTPPRAGGWLAPGSLSLGPSLSFTASLQT